MTESDLCSKERQALKEANKALEDHLSNPLRWDTEGEPYKRTLRDLQNTVSDREAALNACETRGGQSVMPDAP